MRIALLVLGLVAACQATISDPGGIDTPPDARRGSIDDAVSLEIDAPGDVAPACTASQARALYLNFDGQALTRATTSDATQNLASWMNTPSGTAPPYRQNSGTRAADMTAITTGMTAALAPYSVAVVTSRPATGPYMMIVFGGTAGQVGSNYGGAVQRLDCPNAVASDVAWVADAVAPNQRVINYALGAVGFGLGLTATNDPNNCMCGWANNCDQADTPCTFATTINRDPGADQTCPGATQDEQAAIRGGFCQ